MSVVVLKPGLLTTLQDRGRAGYASLGVGSAGAMDEVSLRLANALAGNDDDAAALECTAIGPRLRFDVETTIALAGAAFDVCLDGAAAAMWQPLRVRAGSVLDFGHARAGVRGYLAVAGGFAAERVLGSAATDLNSGVGPLGARALRTDDRLGLIAESADASHRRSRDALARDKSPRWSLDPRPWFDADPSRPIRLIHGAHFGALDAAARHALFESAFQIAAASNRVGLRLDGVRLALRAPLELVSEPVAFGTVQLPPGGQPIVLMAEHPTTGGYPRIAQVAAIDLPRLAQRRPGAALRFEPIDLDEAQTRYLRRERELEKLLGTIESRSRT